MNEDQVNTLTSTPITKIEATTQTNYYDYLSALASNNGL